MVHDVKNEFIKHGLFWCFLIPLMALIFMPVFMPPEAFDLPKDEFKMAAAAGIDVNRATIAATEQFDAWFVRTGIVKGTLEIFQPKVTPKKGIEGFAKWMDDWITGFWLAVYRALWRLHALAPVYLAAAACYVIPAVIDAATVRGRKVYRFEYHNPVYFYSASHAFVLIFGLAFMIPLLPMSLTIAVIFGSALAAAVAAWIAVANFQTGA
jgi:hypothetical protein